MDWQSLHSATFIFNQTLFEMKNLLFLNLILCVTLFSSVQAQSVNDEADMHVFARKFMAAYNEGDHAAIRKMFTDDAVRIDPEGKVLNGGDNIGAYFADQFRLNNLTLLIRQNDLKWSDYEHGWIAHGTYQVYGTTNVYDIKIDQAGKYANTMLKVDGQWKIVKSVLSPATLSSPENVKIVDGLYQSFARGDVPAVLAAMDKSIVWNEAENFPYGDKNPYVGPDAVLNGVFARIGAEWEYWNLTGIKLHDMADNMVLATLRYDAKHKETGKVINSQTAHLWKLTDGKVVAFQQFTDTKQAAEAVSK